jgi:hypothetical protein
MGEGEESQARDGARSLGEREAGRSGTESGAEKECIPLHDRQDGRHKHRNVERDIQPVTKEYNKSLDELVAKPAEKAVGRHLWLLEGVEDVVPFPHGKKDIDFAVKRWGKWYYVDVECRGNWKDGNEFPFWFKTIHIPYRKKTMIATRVPLVYYVVRADNKRAAVLHGGAILQSPHIIQENRMVQGGDSFYDVPREVVVGYEDL